MPSPSESVELIPFLDRPFTDDPPDDAALEPVDRLRRRCKGRALDPALQDRIDHELGVIHRLGLDELYLALHDLCRLARSRGQVAVVAGPAAGSLVVHRLVPGPVNPVRHRLLFERHLDPGQTLAPVFQLDVSGGGLDELLTEFRMNQGFDDPDFQYDSDRAFSREWHPPGGGKPDRAVIAVVEHPGLDTIAKVASLVRDRHGDDAIPDVIPDGDPETMAVFRRGETDDVIGFQDRHLRDRLPAWNPEGIRDLAALLAATSSAAAAVKAEPCESNLLSNNSAVKEVLDETRGVLLYHEQVIELVHRFGSRRHRDSSAPADGPSSSASVAPSAGNSLHRKGIRAADDDLVAMGLLKAMWKRDHDRIDEFRRRFVAGDGSSDTDAIEAGRVFDLIARRGAGTVCKANALTAAHVGYQIAWLKGHYLDEFNAVKSPLHS